MSHPIISKVTKERDKLTAQLIIAKEREQLALKAAARWEVKASMITSLFAKEMQHIRDDIENARTLTELKTWLISDVLDKWSDFLIDSSTLDDMDQSEWETKATALAKRADIRFNPESIQQLSQQVAKEYGLC